MLIKNAKVKEPYLVGYPSAFTACSFKPGSH